MNINVNLISIILYCSGVVGILISFLCMFFRLKKNNKSSAILAIILFVLSIILLGSGTCFKLQDNKKNISKSIVNNDISANASQVVEKNVPSYDDLVVNYKLTSSYNDSNKHANITIKNTSDSIFSGQVNLDFTNSNNETLHTLTLQVKNLLPKKSYNPDAIVDSGVTNITYSFTGDFNAHENVQSPYYITKISTGNNFVRINILVDDTSKNYLEQICNEFAEEYTSNDCDGMLIYFYSQDISDDLNFKNALADYYLDNNTKTSKFTYY